MALNIDDSYVTIAEAEAYFEEDPRAEAFLEEDMTWYLIRATKIIDDLPLRGRKFYLDGSQARQFPREYLEGYDMNELTSLAEVPQNVEDACCEEALAIYLAGSAQSGRRYLQEQGVKSFSIGGKLSETFIDGAGSHRLQSPEARRLMRRYVGAVVR